MKIALIAALSTAVIAVGAAQALDSGGGSTAASSPAASTTEDRTTTSEDKEARRERKHERRREAGEDVRREDRGVVLGEDVSGPCDEAEHANDPRCTGAAPATGGDDRVDTSGPGSSNSGPGSVHSGHGRGDDDRAEHEVEHGVEREAEHGVENEAGDDHGGSSGHAGGSGHGGRDD
jgi:hypothetical protein